MGKLVQIILISSLAISSCKYEDGPKFTLRTKNHRIVNNWTLDKVYEDGKDQSNYDREFFYDYRLDIRKDMSYTISYGARYVSGRIYYEWGEWVFSDDKMELVLTPKKWNFVHDSLPRHWKILRLKENSLWLKGIILSLKEEEVHFKP